MGHLQKLINNKVAGQNPEVSTGIEIETRRNPSKPAIETRQTPSKPIETCQNRRFRLLPKWDSVLPATLINKYIISNLNCTSNKKREIQDAGINN